MEIPITQSKAWQNLQNDLGEKSFYEENDRFSYLAILKTTPVGNYLYCPYGPVANDKVAFKSALKDLKELATKNQAFFIRIEPYDEAFEKAIPKNTKKSKDLNPKETWIIDLKGKDEDLKAKLPSRLLRYHRQAEKKGITIETSHNPSDIHYLLDLQKALAKKKGINTFSEKYLQTELAQPFSTLYLLKYRDPEEKNEEQKAVAAGLVFDDKKTRYNLQGAQNEIGRSLHATGILTIQLILDAKEKGLKTFDFWGIAPEGASKNHPWAGFTAFKKTFAGTEVRHAGTYDVILNSPKYHFYQLIRRINRLKRKIK
ncbi:peptidoglycan bridge formation glycyltransferase FemA/FemB family protein [Candidatus Saccharibacteria bacterium]|nr:peptidoglycan bridge formation glycyltransferase FemA/FemB family protein [Candidatus Saccharibacteria bacterium]